MVGHSLEYIEAMSFLREVVQKVHSLAKDRSGAIEDYASWARICAFSAEEEIRSTRRGSDQLKPIVPIPVERRIGELQHASPFF